SHSRVSPHRRSSGTSAPGRCSTNAAAPPNGGLSGSQNTSRITSINVPTVGTKLFIKTPLSSCYQIGASGDHTRVGSCSRYGFKERTHKSTSVIPVAPESKISVGSTIEIDTPCLCTLVVRRGRRHFPPVAPL